MTITIQSSSVCAGGGHITFVTDKGNFTVSSAEIQELSSDDFEGKRQDAFVVLKHQFLTRRAAGRTISQARNDLDGFTVRL